MFRIFYKIYFIKFKNTKIDNFYQRVVVRMANLVLPLYFGITNLLFPKKSGIKQTEIGEEFIFSLTSFPDRIHYVWLTIESLLRQTEKPDKILLWLYKGEFESKEKLPKNLLKQELRGLEIRFCDVNLRPHKKYFYTVQEYPEANVITVDDDMFYPPNLLERLKKTHQQYPNSILSPMSTKIIMLNGEIQPYVEWPYNKLNTKPQNSNLILSGSGTLFPKNSLHNDTFDIEKINKLSLTTDDLWLTIMSLRQGVRVVGMNGEFPRFYIIIIIKDNQRLMDNNISGGINDSNLKGLMNYYNLLPSVFED